MSVEKKVPELRFAGFSGEWEEILLAGFGAATSGTSIESEFCKNGKYKVISIGSYSEDSLYTDQGIRASLSSKTEARILNKNDLTMILNDKTLAGNIIGRVLLVDEDDSYVYNQRTQRIEPFSKNDAQFLYQLLNAPLVREKIFKNSQGNTQIYVNWSAISKLKYLLPQKKEQTAIGNTFQKLDSLINQHQQKHDKLSSIKKAMLEKMFPKQGDNTPEIRFKGFSGEWEEKELGTDVAEIIGGGTPSTSIPEFWGGNIDWYSPTEIGSNEYADGSQKKITALGLKSSSAKVLPAGNTVLFTSRAGIGYMAILTKPGATNQGFQSFVVKEGFSPYFLYSAGKIIKEYALKHASGSTFLEISGKQLGRMKILMPSTEEQTAIGNYFQKLDNLINQHQNQITKLNNIKQACLSKMFV